MANKEVKKMKSVPLTKYMKESFVRKALNDRFKKTLDSLTAKISAIVTAEFTKQWKEYAEDMAKLPPNCFDSKGWIFLRLGGMSRGHIDFSERIHYPDFVSSDLNIPQHTKLEKLFNEKDKLKEEYDKVRYELKAFFKNTRSSKQLYERWPEARKVHDFETEEVGKAQKKQLPSVTVESLNKSLGLP